MPAPDDDARFAALEARLADLTTEVEQLRNGRNNTMARSHRCPACGGKRVLHFRHVTEATHGGLVDLALHKEQGWVSRTATGLLEAYACRSCRIVEWHARSLDDVTSNGNDIVEYYNEDDAAPPKVPYR